MPSVKVLRFYIWLIVIWLIVLHGASWRAAGTGSLDPLPRRHAQRTGPGQLRNVRHVDRRAPRSGRCACVRRRVGAI